MTSEIDVKRLEALEKRIEQMEHRLHVILDSVDTIITSMPTMDTISDIRKRTKSEFEVVQSELSTYKSQIKNLSDSIKVTDQNHIILQNSVNHLSEQFIKLAESTIKKFSLLDKDIEDIKQVITIHILDSTYFKEKIKSVKNS